MGRNPFSSSIMYGEGYDWTPLYSVRSGQMVGALPVGIETKGDSDAPYWPTQICWTYKEVWTQPVGEWIWLMRDLSGPAVVSGVIDKTNRQPIEFHDEHTGLTKMVYPDRGAFRVLLPQGRYSVRQGPARITLSAISGGTYAIDLRRDKAVDYTVATETEPSGDIILRITAHGIGLHTFSIRADNLDLTEGPQQSANLIPGKAGEIVWHAHIASTETPWVVVVIADHTLADRQEVTGTAHINSAPGN